MPNLDARGDWNIYQNWALPDSRNVTFARFCNPSEPPSAWSSLLCNRLHKLNDHERVVSLFLSTALATPHQRESAGPALWAPCATQRCDLHRLPNQTRAFLKHLITNRPVLKRALIPGLYMYSFDTIRDFACKMKDSAVEAKTEFFSQPSADSVPPRWSSLQHFPLDQEFPHTAGRLTQSAHVYTARLALRTTTDSGHLPLRHAPKTPVIQTNSKLSGSALGNDAQLNLLSNSPRLCANKRRVREKAHRDTPAAKKTH